MKKKNSIMGMAFFGPALVLLTIFLFLPMLLTFGFSFTDYFALNPELTHFVGLENYINIFKDELFVQSFLNTVKFVIIIVPLQCGGALLLALAINKAAHCKKYFKVAFFVPVVMSLAVVSTLWMQIYSPEGILNTLLANFGIDAQPFIPQRGPGAAVHRHHERMAGSGLPDDHLPGRAAEYQPRALRGGGDGPCQRMAEV